MRKGVKEGLNLREALGQISGGVGSVQCSMAKLRSNKYEVVRGIWTSIVVPSVLYGMDSINWTADEKKN